MSKNNTNLIPTRIVNKNGVTTTVHRKSSHTQNAVTRIPSPATMNTETQSHAEWINARLTKLAHVSDETMLNASASFFDTSLGELSRRLLSSGTRTGQRLVADSLSFYVGRLAEHLHSTGKTSASTSAYSGSLIHGEISRKWNYGNIREEAGLDPNNITDEDIEHLKYAHSMTSAGPSQYDDVAEEDHYTMPKVIETHWRGVSALSLCFDFQDESEEADDAWASFDDFITWAGNHDDIGAVIRVAKKHRTIFPEKLEHLMEAERNGVHGSTVEGWL